MTGNDQLTNGQQRASVAGRRKNVKNTKQKDRRRQVEANMVASIDPSAKRARDGTAATAQGRTLSDMS
jgi:hypothetical protein